MAITYIILYYIAVSFLFVLNLQYYIGIHNILYAVANYEGSYSMTFLSGGNGISPDMPTVDIFKSFKIEKVYNI